MTPSIREMTLQQQQLAMIADEDLDELRIEDSDEEPLPSSHKSHSRTQKFKVQKKLLDSI